ncbi:MAG: replicative DNA helicase [Patescibacteria group bacterium]
MNQSTGTVRTDKLPPQNLEAEISTLGALLLDKDAIVKVADILEPNDFYKDAHGDIYEAMVQLYEARTPIDILSLSSRLQEKGKLESVGGHSYLSSLAESVPTASHVVHYAKIVQRKSTLRRMLAAAAEITGLGYQETDDVEDLLDQAERKLYGISQKYYRENFIPIKHVLNEAFDRIDELHKESGKLRGLPTGFADLDNILAGLQKSDLVILAARPSVGKTALALDIARNIATKQKTPVGIFSLEMSKEQLVDRLLCSEANVDMWRMRTGKLSEREDDFPRIGHAMGVLSEAPIFIDDSATANIMEIRAKARRLQLEHGLGLIMVDYLQLMEGRPAENRVQEVAEITRGLKALARELNVPVLALSQLSRAVEMSKPAIPKLSHLRESGSIEQDADVVMFIYRKAADKNYQTEDLLPEERNVAELHVAKHRNGPTGLVKLFFNDAYVSFKSLEKKSTVPPPQ